MLPSVRTEPDLKSDSYSSLCFFFIEREGKGERNDF